MIVAFIITVLLSIYAEKRILIEPIVGSGVCSWFLLPLQSWHGGNDAQKVMGIIGAAIIFYEKGSGRDMSFTEFVNAYTWVPLASFTAIAIGTMSGGGRLLKRWEPGLPK